MQDHADPILIRRKINRIEKQIAALQEQAYEAYWHIGNLACQAIERQIVPLERELVRLESSIYPNSREEVISE